MYVKYANCNPTCSKCLYACCNFLQYLSLHCQWSDQFSSLLQPCRLPSYAVEVQVKEPVTMPLHSSILPSSSLCKAAHLERVVSYYLSPSPLWTVYMARWNSGVSWKGRSGWLPDGVYVRLRRSAATVPRLYGLPKVHKQDVPLRHIASFISSLTYQLSKFLVGLLAPIVGQTSYHVQNSVFCRFISTQVLAEEQILVSFHMMFLWSHGLHTVMQTKLQCYTNK